MLLAIDVGNTQTVIGLYGRRRRADGDGAERRACSTTGASPPTPSARPTSTRCWSRSSSASTASRFDDDIDGIAISLGRCPRVTAAFREMTERYFGFRPVVVEPGREDRHADPLRQPEARSAPTASPTRSARIDLYGGPTIVVDFGTATTFDAISAKGEYLGGAIAPGIDISLDALYRPGRRAAPRRAGRAPQRHRPQHRRVAAVGRGLRLRRRRSTACARRIGDELGDVDRRRHRRPGRADRARTRRSIEHLEPWLTLHGLRLIFDERTEPAEPDARHQDPMADAAPYRFEPTRDAAAAERLRATSSRASETRSSVTRRRPAHAAARAGQAGVRHARRTATGRIQLFAPADDDAPTSRSSATCPSATGSASRARS